MFVLVVGYGHPEDPEDFDLHYRDVHAPLAQRIPGLRLYTYRHCQSLDGTTSPPYYLLAELSFDDEQALRDALASAEAAAAVADVPSFASGGVTMFVARD